MMSRLLDDVATLFSLQADVATASDSVLMSRPLPDVATSMFSQLYILCRDFYMVSRPHCPLYWVQFCRDLLVLPSITILLRLEFLCNTPKYTLVVFDMFRAFCKLNLTVS